MVDWEKVVTGGVGFALGALLAGTVSLAIAKPPPKFMDTAKRITAKMISPKGRVRWMHMEYLGSIRTPAGWLHELYVFSWDVGWEPEAFMLVYEREAPRMFAIYSQVGGWKQEVYLDGELVYTFPRIKLESVSPGVYKSPHPNTVYIRFWETPYG